MSRNTKFYSQAKCSVIVAAADGSWSRTLKDFAEGDDVIAWKPNGEKVTITDGFDQAGISISSAKSGSITVKLKSTSADVGALTKIYNLHQTAPQLVTVSIVTGVETNEKLIDAAVDIPDGGSTGGTKMTDYTFIFKGKQLSMDES